MSIFFETTKISSEVKSETEREKNALNNNAPIIHCTYFVKILGKS